MKIEHHLPADRLKPFIKNFLIVETQDEMESKVLPDTSIVMSFRFKGAVSSGHEGLPASGIAGLRKSSRVLGYAKETGNLLVMFKEGGAAAFFNTPMHELFNNNIPLDVLFPPAGLKDVQERLAGAKDHLHRISIIEDFLLSQLKDTTTDLLILHAVQQIKLSNGNIRIKELLSDLPISQDPFEKRFRKVIGTSAKQFSAIIRLRSIIDSYSATTNLTATAYNAGYFDQSHFIKDFRSFTGQSPKDFFKSPAFW